MSKEREAVIVGALRTPIGSFDGRLRSVDAPELGARVIRALLEQNQVTPDRIDEVIMGNVLQAGLGQNPARQAAIRADLPYDVPSFTVNKVCGSGLKTVQLGMQSIEAGEADIVVAGGMENMTRAPYLLEGARSGYRMGDQNVIDSMMRDGLNCAVCDIHMGITAENVNEHFDIGREAQDRFAAWSHEKASAAIREERFHDEIVPIQVKGKKGRHETVETDEHPRSDTTEASLSRLRPAFQREGTVTAGNASGINDGAAAVLMMSRETAAALNLSPLVVFKANARAGVDPRMMGCGPIPAVQKALNRAGLTVQDIGLVELNEAFAAQSLAVSRQLAMPDETLNVNGGAIALGHPIGASGTRVLVTLIHEMKRRDVNHGLAALCIGGGQGIATVVSQA